METFEDPMIKPNAAGVFTAIITWVGSVTAYLNAWQLFEKKSDAVLISLRLWGQAESHRQRIS
jgi:hypothetical protein